MFNKKILLIFILFFSSFNYTFADTIEPEKVVSGLDSCYYTLSGNSFDGNVYEQTTNVINRICTRYWHHICIRYSYIRTNTNNIPIACDGNIDIESLSDGIYNVGLFSKDKTTIPAANITNFDNIEIKLDRNPIKCDLNEVIFEGINNQYYNDGKIYYRSHPDASGTIKLNISCTDGEQNVSGIKEINFPEIFGDKPGIENYDENTTLSKDYILSYSLDGAYGDSFDILKENFSAIDWAGNETLKLDGTNTKIILKRNLFDTGYIINGPISTLTLTPDSEAPLINNKEIDLFTNLFNNDSFKYKTGNDGNGIYSTIYSGLNDIKYMSALNNRTIQTPKISDNGSGVRGYKFEIETSGNKLINTEYNYELSSSLARQTEISSDEKQHDFSKVSTIDDYSNGFREYTFDFYSIDGAGNETEDQICDMVGNCISFNTPDFKIVANEYDENKSIFKIEGGVPISVIDGKDGDGEDSYNVEAYFKDKYNNEIVPVHGVKSINITTDFINTMGLDQIEGINSGDGVFINFRDGNGTIIPISSNNSQFTHNSSDYDELNNGLFAFDIYSFIPTYDKYITKDGDYLYGLDDTQAKLKLEKLSIKSSSLLPYSGIGENIETDITSIQTDFQFDPIVNFDYIEPIFPLVEGQNKKIEISNSISKPNYFDYSLNINIGSNNDFLQFNNTRLEAGNRYDGNKLYNIYGKEENCTNNCGVIPNNSYANKDILNILPQTVGGIEDDNTNIALSSVLEYTLSSQTVKLPGIQTGFKDFGYHPEDDFTYVGPSGETMYSDDNVIIFSQIDIAGITQTNNLGTEEGEGATTTDSATTKFDDFSTISLLDLKTDINKNVYELLGGFDMNEGIVDPSVDKGEITLSDLNDFSTLTNGIVIKDGNVIYFRNTDVEINCGTICEISGKKTIIVENGNITINSNMYYTDENSILGLILIGNEASGNTSQLRINENITNGVGIVYSEGPVVSVNDSGDIYDGTNVGENLSNQLYWKGSFITRNTVGGSISSINGDCPYGTPYYEVPEKCNTNTSQAYDLIYLRRYARVNESLYVTDPLDLKNPMGDGKVPLHYDSKNVLISGNREVESMKNMDDGESELIKSDNFNAPLIIEYDSRIQSLPPYGFE